MMGVINQVKLTATVQKVLHQFTFCDFGSLTNVT